MQAVICQGGFGLDRITAATSNRQRGIVRVDFGLHSLARLGFYFLSARFYARSPINSSINERSAAKGEFFPQYLRKNSRTGPFRQTD